MSPMPLARDTTPEAEVAWLDRLRAMGPGERCLRMLEWSGIVQEMALAAFDRRHPAATSRERRLWMLRECHGAEVAERYAAARWPDEGDGR